MNEAGKILQEKLELIENPCYTWSIFPEWKKKIERDYLQKSAYMEEVQHNVSMHYQLIHHNYRFQLINKDSDIELLREELNKVISMKSRSDKAYSRSEKELSILKEKVKEIEMIVQEII